jgi:hypothetical protein
MFARYYTRRVRDSLVRLFVIRSHYMEGTIQCKSSQYENTARFWKIIFSLCHVKNFCQSTLQRTLRSDFPKPCQILKSSWAPVEKLCTWNSLCYDLHQSIWSVHPSIWVAENMRWWHQRSWKGPSLFKMFSAAENNSTFLHHFSSSWCSRWILIQWWLESIIASLRREKANFEVLD